MHAVASIANASRFMERSPDLVWLSPQALYLNGLRWCVRKLLDCDSLPDPIASVLSHSCECVLDREQPRTICAVFTGNLAGRSVARLAHVTVMRAVLLALASWLLFPAVASAVTIEEI